MPDSPPFRSGTLPPAQNQATPAHAPNRIIHTPRPGSPPVSRAVPPQSPSAAPRSLPPSRAGRAPRRARPARRPPPPLPRAPQPFRRVSKREERWYAEPDRTAPSGFTATSIRFRFSVVQWKTGGVYSPQAINRGCATTSGLGFRSGILGAGCERDEESCGEDRDGSTTHVSLHRERRRWLFPECVHSGPRARKASPGRVAGAFFISRGILTPPPTAGTPTLHSRVSAHLPADPNRSVRSASPAPGTPPRDFLNRLFPWKASSAGSNLMTR